MIDLKALLENPAAASNRCSRFRLVCLLMGMVVFACLTFDCHADNHLQMTNNQVWDRSAETAHLPQGLVTFLDSHGHTNQQVVVEVAADERDQAQGLMFRQKLPENRGMLFTYEKESPLTFWMKDTGIPLDIVFIDRSLKIIKIFKNVIPFSDDFYDSGLPAQHAVEVAAGFTDRYSVAVGDHIQISVSE